MNKRLKGEGRLGEGEGRGRGGVEGEGEGEGDEEGRGGDGRKRSQRTHPSFVYKLVLSLNRLYRFYALTIHWTVRFSVYNSRR